MQVLDRLKAFVSIVEEGSLSAAVKKLHITQPALSTRIKLLEDDLGCQLLERTGRGVKPTALGSLVYGVGRDIIERIDDLKTLVQNHQELKEGWVHLSGDSTAVAGILPDAISVFKQSYKNIKFTLREDKIYPVLQALADGSIHIAVIPYSSLLHEGERFKSLTTHIEIKDEFRIIAPNNHPLVNVSKVLKTKGQKLLPLHINGQSIILYEDETLTAEELEIDFRRLGIKPQVAMFLKSNQSVIEMVRKGIGVSLMSEHLVKEQAGISILDIEGISIKRKLLICTNSEISLPLAAKKFLEFLLGVYSKSQDG